MMMVDLESFPKKKGGGGSRRRKGDAILTGTLTSLLPALLLLFHGLPFSDYFLVLVLVHLLLLVVTVDDNISF